MASFNKFETFVGDLGKKIHDLQAGGDVIKAYLTNAVPSTSADSVKADLAEITAEHGYVAGGIDIQNGWTETGGIGTMTAVDINFVASGGSFGPFRHVVIYNDTATNDPLIGWWTHSVTLTIEDGGSFPVDFGASVLTLE